MYVCHINKSTWPPSIYPSHVSIFLPYDWIRHGLYNRTLDDLPDPPDDFWVIECHRAATGQGQSLGVSGSISDARCPRSVGQLSLAPTRRQLGRGDWVEPREVGYITSHRIQSYGIYANMNGDIWGILMVNVTPYMAYMDPMGLYTWW